MWLLLERWVSEMSFAILEARVIGCFLKKCNPKGPQGSLWTKFWLHTLNIIPEKDKYSESFFCLYLCLIEFSLALSKRGLFDQKWVNHKYMTLNLLFHSKTVDKQKHGWHKVMLNLAGAFCYLQSLWHQTWYGKTSFPYKELSGIWEKKEVKYQIKEITS